MKLLTVEQVAKEHLAVSRSTVMRLIENGSLPAVCLHRGKRKAIYRIRPEVLERWIRDRESKGKKPEPSSSTTTKGTQNNGLDGDALESKSRASEK